MFWHTVHADFSILDVRKSDTLVCHGCMNHSYPSFGAKSMKIRGMKSSHAVPLPLHEQLLPLYSIASYHSLKLTDLLLLTIECLRLHSTNSTLEPQSIVKLQLSILPHLSPLSQFLYLAAPAPFYIPSPSPRESTSTRTLPYQCSTISITSHCSTIQIAKRKLLLGGSESDIL